MAGDWIKMRNNLDSDPRVFAIAESLGLEDLHVIGLLWKVWAWADQHTVDGNAVSVTVSRLDRIVGVTGFADALRKVGWLEGRDSSLSFPRFAEHNGQTAKTRAQTADRVAKKRNAVSVTKALPEKRREEKSITHTHTPQSDTKSGRIKDARQLNAEGFQESWNQWCDYRLSQDGRELSPISGEAEVLRLSTAGPEKAKRDINFSLRKGSRSILDSDNDFEKNAAERRKNAQGNKRGSAVMSVAELLGNTNQEASK